MSYTKKEYPEITIIKGNQEERVGLCGHMHAVDAIKGIKTFMKEQGAKKVTIEGMSITLEEKMERNFIVFWRKDTREKTSTGELFLTTADANFPRRVHILEEIHKFCTGAVITGIVEMSDADLNRWKEDSVRITCE